MWTYRIIQHVHLPHYTACGATALYSMWTYRIIQHVHLPHCRACSPTALYSMFTYRIVLNRLSFPQPKQFQQVLLRQLTLRRGIKPLVPTLSIVRAHESDANSVALTHPILVSVISFSVFWLACLQRFLNKMFYVSLSIVYKSIRSNVSMFIALT